MMRLCYRLIVLLWVKMALISLYTWILGKDIRRCGLLEEVCPWKRALRFHRLTPFPVPLPSQPPALPYASCSWIMCKPSATDTAPFLTSCYHVPRHNGHRLQPHQTVSRAYTLAPVSSPSHVSLHSNGKVTKTHTYDRSGWNLEI